MSRIKIETITPIHIGSGNSLLQDDEFVTFNDEYDALCAGIIDMHKIANLFSYEKLARFVSGGGKVTSLLKNYNIEDYCSRIDWITCNSELIEKGRNVLAEQIHNGMGNPYIPGSSIKGAIRSAVLPYLMKQTHFNFIVDKKSDVEKRIFGEDIVNEFMRFIQVGDANFDGADEIITSVYNLSKNKPFTLPRVLSECIDRESEGEFSLKIKSELNQFCVIRNSSVKQIPEQLKNISGLFAIINAHSQKLINDEIEFWNIRKIDVTDRNILYDIKKYTDDLTYTLKEFQKTDAKSCILRLGFGSGKTFITGALNETWDELQHKKTPKQIIRDNYSKARRIVNDFENDSDIFMAFGFVKLTQI